MYNFLRISSSYPEFIKIFKKKLIKKNYNTYDQILENYFKESYSVSNNITEELIKKNYQCTEIVSNFDFLQNKWLEQYGDKNNKENIIIQQIKFYKPDIIFFGNADLINENMLKTVKKMKFVKILIGFHCAPFNRRIINRLNKLDCIVTCTKGYKDYLYNTLKKDILLIQHSFPKQHINKASKKEIDISFIGSIFIGKALHNKRVNLIYELMKNFQNTFISINFSNKLIFILILRLISSVFKFKILKEIIFLYKLIYIYLFSKKPVFGVEMFNLVSKSKILINTHIDDTEYAGNMRLFEGTGLGCLVLTDYKKDLDKLFKIGNEIDVYENERDLIEKCKYYLSNEKKLNTVSALGQRKTIENYNYEKRILILDQYIKEKLKSNEKNI